MKVTINEMKMEGGGGSRGKIAALAGAVLALALLAGCKTAVDAQGQYSAGGETVSGGINATTNAVTVSGDFQTGTTNIGGSATIQK